MACEQDYNYNICMAAEAMLSVACGGQGGRRGEVLDLGLAQKHATRFWRITRLYLQFRSCGFDI